MSNLSCVDGKPHINWLSGKFKATGIGNGDIRNAIGDDFDRHGYFSASRTVKARAPGPE